MKPDGLLNEYMSSLVSGIRFVLLMIVSGLIADRKRGQIYFSTLKLAGESGLEYRK
jgi:hypothetical protein